MTKVSIADHESVQKKTWAFERIENLSINQKSINCLSNAELAIEKLKKDKRLSVIMVLAINTQSFTFVCKIRDKF